MTAQLPQYLVLAIVVLAAAASPRPEPSAIKPEPIARAARYPGRLEVHQESSGEMSKAYGTPLWAARVSAADGSFASVTILLLDGGAFLTPEVTQRFDQAIAAPESYAAGMRSKIVGGRSSAGDGTDRRQADQALAELDRLCAQGPLVRAVRLASRRRGYSAVLDFGRFDATVAAILPSPDGRYEVLVSMAMPLDRDGRTVPQEMGRYRTRLEGEPLSTTAEIALSIFRQLFPPPRKQ